jgi:hypothetical protein
MRRWALALAALTLTGCAAQDFTKEGASEEQFVRDEQLCRTQVRRMTANQRVVDESRRDTHRADQARTGQSTLPDVMAAQGEQRSSGRLMEQCMVARGWTPKAPWWQRLGS